MHQTCLYSHVPKACINTKVVVCLDKLGKFLKVTLGQSTNTSESSHRSQGMEGPCIVLTCKKGCARTSYLTISARQTLGMALHELQKFLASVRQLSRGE